MKKLPYLSCFLFIHTTSHIHFVFDDFCDSAIDGSSLQEYASWTRNDLESLSQIQMGIMGFSFTIAQGRKARFYWDDLIIQTIDDFNECTVFNHTSFVLFLLSFFTFFDAFFVLFLYDF